MLKRVVLLFKFWGEIYIFFKILWWTDSWNYSIGITSDCTTLCAISILCCHHAV